MKKKQLDELKKVCESCDKCPLCETRTNVVFGSGNANAKILIIGEAPGDFDAAEKNGVHYYPILVNHEKESWDEAIAVAYDKLRSGEYAAYGAEMKQKFLQHLGG